MEDFQMNQWIFVVDSIGMNEVYDNADDFKLESPLLD